MEGLKDCFVQALEGIRLQYHHLPSAHHATESASRDFRSSSTSNAADTSAASADNVARSGEESTNSGPLVDSVDIRIHELVDEEPHQSPPRLSRTAVMEAGGGVKEDSSLRELEVKTSKHPKGSNTGSIDLHYLNPDIIGSWPVRLIQGGLCAELVER